MLSEAVLGRRVEDNAPYQNDKVTIVATGFSLGARAYAAGVATIQILLR